jgi:hypothetical protein
VITTTTDLRAYGYRGRNGTGRVGRSRGVIHVDGAERGPSSGLRPLPTHQYQDVQPELVADERMEPTTGAPLGIPELT